MGPEFYPCSQCDEVYCDCGVYYHCTTYGCDLCETCGGKAIEKYGSGNPKEDDGFYSSDNPDGCEYCDPNNINDDDLMLYLLTRLGLTKEEAKAHVLQERKQDV